MKMNLLVIAFVFGQIGIFGQTNDFNSGLFSKSRFDSDLGIEFASLFQGILPKPSYGVNIRYGISDDDKKFWFNSNRMFKRKWRSIFYIHAGYYFRQRVQSNGQFFASTSNPLLENPKIVTFDLNESVQYFLFGISDNLYLFTNKKEQFALYVGWKLGLDIPVYSLDYEIGPFNESDYSLNTPDSWQKNRKASTVNSYAGINLGFDIYFGELRTLFLEFNTFSNWQTSKILPPEITVNSNFFSGINLGYRLVF